MYSSAPYKASPVWVQEWLLAGRSLLRNRMREGGRFRRALAEIERTQWNSKEELLEYQLKRMSALVQHAAKNVPYYRALFEEHGLDPGTFRRLEDFARIPLLTKQQVVQAGDALVAASFRGIKFAGSTSGTTGMYLRGYRDLTSIARENAFLRRQLEWAGFRSGDRRAWLRGDEIVSLEQAAPPFWRWNRADHMLMLSSYHLSDDSAAGYVEALERFDPVVIQAYPASIAFLAKHLENHDRHYAGARLRGIVTSSESLLDEQRRVTEERFKVRVFDWYGSFERVAAISTCEQGNYHVLSDYGFVELVPEADGTAEIVGTGFDNFVMPLLRYRSLDSVVPADASYACPCRRQFPVIEKVLGRVLDQIKTRDGRHHVALDLIFYGLKTVAEGQIVQDRIDHVTILVVPLGGNAAEDAEEVKRRAIQRLGSSFNVDVELVKEIPRTRAGKFRCIVCRV